MAGNMANGIGRTTGRESAQFKEESDVASGQQVIRSVALGLGSFRQRGGIREVLPFWSGYLFGISPWSCFETISYIFGFEKVWFIRYSTLLLVGLLLSFSSWTLLSR
jgi:hypothetical protein